MTRLNLFTKVYFLVIAIIFSAIPKCSSILSDKRLCYDPDCSKPISLARTNIKYNAGEKGMLTVPLGALVKVYSKGAGKRPGLWGIEYNEKRGYLPLTFLQEYKVFHKNLTYEVPTEFVNNNNNNDKKDNRKDNVNNNVSNLKDSSKNEKNNADSIPQYSSPSNTNIDASVPTSNGESIKHFTSETENIASSYDVIDGTTIFGNNEASTQSSYNFAKKVENIYTNINPTATQIKLDTPTKTTKLQEVTDFQELEIATEDDISSDHIKSDEPITTSQSAEEDYITLLNIELEQKKENSDKDSFTFESVHKEENSGTNGTTFQSEDEKDKNDPAALTFGYHEETKNMNSYNSAENNVDSSVIKTKEGDKTEKDLSEIKHKKEEHDVPSITTESEQNKETEVTGVAIEDKSETDFFSFISQTQKEIEVESDTHASKINPTSNVISEEKYSISKSEQTDDSKNLLDVIKPIEIIHNGKEDVQQFVAKDNVFKRDVQKNVCDHNPFKAGHTCDIDANVAVQEQTEIISEEDNQMIVQDGQMNIVNNDTLNNNIKNESSSSVDVPMQLNITFEDNNEKLHNGNDKQLSSSQSNAKDIISEQIFHEFHSNRNLLHAEEKVLPTKVESDIENAQNVIDDLKTETLPGYENIIKIKDKVLSETEDEDIVKEEVLYNENPDDFALLEETTLHNTINDIQFSDVCTMDNDCANDNDNVNYGFTSLEEESVSDGSIMKMIRVESTYWITLLYLSITAIATLVFSLGYYYIENMRRDSQLIAKINKLEKELLLSTKECLTLDETLKSTKDKLNSIQDESFGSNEMVLSLKADLEVSQSAKVELEDQIAMLEKDLESATEAGLELERMLREVLSSNNEVNPLAQSVEDLQARLNAQQSANESLTNALNIKTQEHEALSAELVAMKKKYEELDTEFMHVTENLQTELKTKTKIQEDLNNTIQQLEGKIKQFTMDKTSLCKELKIKEAEVKDLVEVINQVNSNNLDIEKLFDVLHIKIEASQLREERDELKIRLSEVEGAHSLLEEHMKVVKEEVSALSEQCKLAEKEKRDAETRLEVISNFFKEKEAQRQKEEALWLQKQGEVMSTVERIHTMQNEIHGYKQQIEMLKREIVDQEREYKAQISTLETKAHEQWVTARQNERRLEEAKAEAGQIRNRLTLIEKNINDADIDTKLHRLEANGETTTSPPLFIGAESSSSPIMFTGSSGVPPPPPPSFMHPSLFPTYLPPPLPSASGLPPYDVGQRPPPLGGRLSSPPPIPLHPPPSGRYENADSPPPLMSPPLLPPFNHRSHPHPFASDHMHPPPPPPPGSILLPPLGTSHSWGEETLPPPRNSGFHPHQREQRARNHKGSLHSSGESLDKSHHSGKV